MGILNVQKLTSSVNIHEWPHGYFEYSKADVMDILNIYEVTSLVFWIRSDVMELFRSWRHGYFEYSCDIVIFNIQIYVVFWKFYSNDVTSRIFKIPITPAFNIPMTALWVFKIFKIPMVLACEYLNCTWRHFMHTQNTHDVTSIFIKLPLTSPHEVTSWVFKRPITSLHEFSKYPWRIFKLPMRHFEYSQSDVMGILEYSWSDVMGILNIQIKCNFEYVTWIFWIILNIHDIGILNILEVMSWVFWIFKRGIILNMNFKIPMTSASEYFHNVTSWVFKIPMTSPHEYSKYP